MSYWTGPCCLYSDFLQKNGGEGCHRGQDLVDYVLDVSIMWWHRFSFFLMILDRHERNLKDPTPVVSSTAQYAVELKDT